MDDKNERHEQNVLVESSETDNENVEQGRNWRCRLLFNGLVQDYALPPDCGRPQSDEGRTFPASKSQYYEFFDTIMESDKHGNLPDDVVETIRYKSADLVLLLIFFNFLLLFCFCVLSF